MPEVSTTTIPVQNPIAPHGASSAWGVASVVVLLVILAAAAAMVWLFFSYRQHLWEHRVHEDGPGA